MKVYITDLAAYNQGFLIGEWVAMGELSNEELNQAIKEIFRLGEEACKDGSIHEEYFLTDWEGEECFQVGEYTNVFKLNEEIAHFEGLNLDGISKKCVSFLLSDNIVSDLDEALEKYEDCLFYEDMSFLDLAYEIADEHLDGLSQFMVNYFDHITLASDLELEYTAKDGDIFYYPY